ncbi:MAG: DEAD/DEAH box helicase [Firmicutes bacterium]|nr:DEAD/DEAH box helicase [Bacillota bacterium]
METRTALGLTPAELKAPPGAPVSGEALLTERETRELLKLKPEQLAKALELGLLVGIPAGRQRLITLASVVECLREPARLDPIRDEELITPGEAGKLLGLGPRELAALVDADVLTPILADGGPRFRRGDVRALLADPPPELEALRRPPGGRRRRESGDTPAAADGPREAGDAPDRAQEAGAAPENAADATAFETELVYVPAGKGRPVRLDRFQVEAERLLAEGMNVLVSAPTGSGKSLIAERLVERARAEGVGLIYTGPIKALINQKFRDLCRIHGHEQVGIITGDVVIRENAPVLVMTTEIFRNMAVGHPESLQGYGYLVLDEVHYLDSDRGAAWEESIIFAPPHLQILALSATVANAGEIAAWIESVTGRPTRVVQETRRPVPLSIHYAGPSGRITDLDRALAELEEPVRGRRWGGRDRDRGRADHVAVVRRVARRGWLPCLYFVFSRMGCEEKARELSLAMNFLRDDERDQVLALLEDRETEVLRGSGSYRLLRECLVRGVGFHHAGMLPQAKEIVEELYEAGLVKVLYCTETFAVGVNFPVKAAIFDGVRKFDGQGFRPLTALEFHQMAGRAGRRGIDREGHAVLLLSTQDREDVRDYARLKPEPVMSRLELRPNTVLNLIATRSPEEIEAVLTRSLKVFQANRAGKVHEERAAAARRRLEELKAILCEQPGTMACPAVRAPWEEEARHLEQRLRELEDADSPRARRLRRQTEERLAQVRSRLAEAEPIPHTPEQLARCQQHLEEYRQLEKELKRQEKRARKGQRVAEELLQQFYSWKKRLEELQFIEGDQLLPRGVFAREIHVEEIAVTELYFSGFFHRAREEEICAILACLAFDGKDQGDTLPRKPSGPVRQALGIVARYAENFHRGFYAPAYDWARERDFVAILHDYSFSEGDLINAFRRTIDLLRQVRRAVGPDPIKEKIDRCMQRMDRPPVTVELE